MTGSRLVRTLGSIGAVLALAQGAHAATQIYVTFAGRDDSLPKLGRPGIGVRVDAGMPGAAAELTKELARELALQVHTRPLAKDESGDYELDVALGAPRVVGEDTTVPFEAALVSADGRRLWRIEGRAEVTGAPVEAPVFAGIGRNVISALIHDGWVQPRYDPDDPPPPPPVVRTVTP